MSESSDNKPHSACTDVQLIYTDKSNGMRAWWCEDHQQYVYEGPVEVTYTYGDGSTANYKLW